MADVVKSLRLFLLTKSAVTSLVGSRIYTDVIPQAATRPAVALSKVSSRHNHTLSALAGLAHSRIQVDIEADKANGGRETANEIAEAIAKCGIVGTKGETQGTDIRGVRIEDGQRHEVYYPRDDSDDLRYVTQFDFEIDFNEDT